MHSRPVAGSWWWGADGSDLGLLLTKAGIMGNDLNRLRVPQGRGARALGFAAKAHHELPRFWLSEGSGLLIYLSGALA
jgi:hypothetical protein